MPLLTIPPTDNRCTSCGERIPEGRQVCPRCEREAQEKVENSLVFGYTINLIDIASQRKFSYSSSSYELARKQFHKYKHSRKVRVTSYNFDPYK